MAMFAPETHATVAAFVLTQTRAQLDTLAAEKDVPLHTLPVSAHEGSNAA